MAAGPRPTRPPRPPQRSVHRERPILARPDGKPAQPHPATDDAHNPGGFGPLPTGAGQSLQEATCWPTALRPAGDDEAEAGPGLRRNVRAAGATGRVVTGSVEF